MEILKCQGIRKVYGTGTNQVTALDGIDLSVAKGEFVAIVGSSGSGKSTLAKVLAGLLKYQQGGVFLDSSPLEGLSLETLYEKLSFLSQEAPVFDGTLRENLVFGKEVPDARIKEALEQVQLLPLLSSLPEGPETRVGEKGACLSGGERQRVKLAKYLGQKGSIYVLDEPTTGLHASDVKTIMKLLDGFVEQGNTVVVIEHNMDVVKLADYVIDMGPDGGTMGGEVVFTGTPQELAEYGQTITADYLRKC